MVILLLARVSYILDSVNEVHRRRTTRVLSHRSAQESRRRKFSAQPETRLKDAHARPRLPLPCLPHPLRDARLPSFHELFELVQWQQSEDGVGVGVGVSIGVMAWVLASRRGVGLASGGVLRVGRGVSGSEASAGQRQAGHGRISTATGVAEHGRGRRGGDKEERVGLVGERRRQDAGRRRCVCSTSTSGTSDVFQLQDRTGLGQFGNSDGAELLLSHSHVGGLPGHGFADRNGS
ncbi:hypothetical protein FB45DRAFT_867419 [Roridomyces roridus]|uniref:Uncharacterized protein n=1 Tax=Roridomyces roridus TaxID=1738132 RepID=A0AAD7BQX4_9AGAR|nr:hypothetical protein FB45DRAFT_867419 [Roridomyces roridus]